MPSSLSRSIRPGTGTALSSGSYRRPSQGQLSNFLDMPRSAATATTSPGSQTRSFDTRRGGTVTVGRGAGSGTTPGGVNVGGAGRGVKVETAGGRTLARGTGAIGASNGTSAALRGGSFRAGQGQGGNTRFQSAGRGIATDGRNVYRSRGYTGAVRGPNGNVVARGARIGAYNGTIIGGRQIAAVRGRFWGYRNYFTPGWYARYPGAWFYAGAVAGSWWSGAGWGATSGYCDYYNEPVSYDYGTNVTYDEQGLVYHGEQAVASANQYYEQAEAIADSGPKSENEEWMALGVFAVVADNQTSTDKILQLAINKEGAIRGNLHDKLTDKVTQVVGALDKKSQRVAIRLVGNDSLVAECGLWNITQDALTVLIHVDKDQVERRTLIRLENDQQTATDAPTEASGADK